MINDGQRKLLIAAMCLFLATGIYLPFATTRTETNNQTRPPVTTTVELGTDYYWAWDMPSSRHTFGAVYSYRLDVTRLLIEWVFIVVLTGGAFVLLGSTPKGPSSDLPGTEPKTTAEGST